VAPSRRLGQMLFYRPRRACRSRVRLGLGPSLPARSRCSIGTNPSSLAIRTHHVFRRRPATNSTPLPGLHASLTQQPAKLLESDEPHLMALVSPIFRLSVRERAKGCNLSNKPQGSTISLSPSGRKRQDGLNCPTERTRSPSKSVTSQRTRALPQRVHGDGWSFSHEAHLSDGRQTQIRTSPPQLWLRRLLR